LKLLHNGFAKRRAGFEALSSAKKSPIPSEARMAVLAIVSNFSSLKYNWW